MPAPSGHSIVNKVLTSWVVRMNLSGTNPPAPVARRTMPFRHKLMLLLAVEIVAFGFQQAERNPHRPGISVEVPARAGHMIA